MKKTMGQYRSPTLRLKLYCLILILLTLIVLLYFLYVKPTEKPKRMYIRDEVAPKRVDVYDMRQEFDNSHRKTYRFEGYKMVHIDLKGAPPKISYFKQLFPFLHKMGATGIVLEYEDMFPYSGKLKNISATNAYTLKDIEELNFLAMNNNLEVIPLVQTFGHLEFLLKLDEFIHLREVEEFPSAICPSHADTMPLITDMVKQVLEAHPLAKTIHIGADEVFLMGVCDRCINRMDKFNLSKKLLYMDHVNSVANVITKLNPDIGILIWDDVLRTSSLGELKKGSLHKSLIPVVWKYTKDVEDELGPSLWNMYSHIFSKVWIASAFKGATGSDQFVSEVSHYVENHRSWMSLVSEQKNKIIFEGIIITGWQRYDHFAVLCELLPVSLPSLAMCLRLLLGHNDSPLAAPTDVAKLLQCRQPYGLIGSAFGTPRCSYPGAGILENVLRLQQLKIEFEHFLDDSRTKGWMSEYNIAHDFSNPQYVISVSAPLRTVSYELDQLDSDITTAMLEVYDNYTINEWKETFVYTFRKQLRTMLNAREKILERKSWPRRPFQPIEPTDKEL